MKVALLFICVNDPYWGYLKDVRDDVDRYFLKNHQVDIFCWSDMPEIGTKEFDAVSLAHPDEAEVKKAYDDLEVAAKLNPTQIHSINEQRIALSRVVTRESIEFIVRNTRKEGITIFPIDPITWPMGTLMRYHLFLQQEELLKTYDYIFYLDVDMRIVDIVGDEILGDGLTMAQHPMYALARRYIPPYEPNPNSSAYVPRFGRIMANEDGERWLEPLYAAGGFQGGKSAEFIKAMWSMKRAIDRDFKDNYVAIWNDESHWNYYLSQHPPSVVLSPSYIYPDSLIKEYYIPIWGKLYPPKIITLTKKFSLSKDSGTQLRDTLNQMHGL